MRRTILSIIIALFLGGQHSSSQTTKEWRQSSLDEFLGGEFENTQARDFGGAEVRLLPPMTKTLIDTLSGRYLHRRVYNASGSQLRFWRANGEIYLQRFDTFDNPIGDSVVANEPDKPAYGEVSAAYLENGFSLITWSPDFTYGSLFQLLDSSLQKVGGNRFMTDFTHDPVALAHLSDSTFWIFVPKVYYYGGAEAESTIVYIWKVNLAGLVIDSLVRIHPTNFFAHEYQLRAASCRKNDFLLLFVGSNWNTAGGQNLFLQRFFSDGSPKGDIMGVSSAEYLDYQFPQIAFDDAERYAVLWSDNRPRPPQSPPGWNLYLQLFDSTDRRVGENLVVNALKDGIYDRWYPAIFYRDSMYVVSWQADWAGSALLPYYNKWVYNFDSTGTFTSSVFDAGPLLTGYDTLSWTASLPAMTSLKFQLRTGNTPSELDAAQWLGPGSGTDSFYAVSGAGISLPAPPGRLIQYRAHLLTSSWGDTPAMEEVALAYTTLSVSPPDPPKLISAEAGHGLVTLRWHASPSPGIFQYRIYRGGAPRSYDSSWTKIVPDSVLTFTDSNVVNTESYYYAVTALDTNLQESDYSNEGEARPNGTVVYVSAGALIGGNGTFESPFQTIQEATASVLSYDTVFVLPGTYTGMVRIPAHVALQGSGPRTCTIEASGDSNVVRCGTGSTLSGFTVRQTGWISQGIAVSCGSSGATVADNVLISMVPEGGPTDYVAIFANGGSPLIRRNYIVDFEGGIGITAPATPTITNNVILVRLGGIMINNDAVAAIINNTIVLSRFGSGISAYSYPEGNVRNNIIVGSSTNGGQAFDTPCFLEYVQLTVEYNDAWNFHDEYTCVNAGPGNISSDPRFVNTAAGDYRLRESSPCKHAGDPDILFNNPDDSRSDMGAFGGPQPIDLGQFSGFDISLGAGNVSGFPGDSVEVDISADKAARLAHAEFTLEYDKSIVALLSAERTEFSDPMQLVLDTTAGGILRAELSDSVNLNRDGGSLLQLKFRIDPASEAGAASPLRLSGISLRDELSSPLPLHALQHGVIVVSPGSEGGRYVFVDQRNTGETEDGTRFHPCKTIGKGIALAHAGDTVLVAAGIYEEIVSLPDSIHIQGAGATVTVLRPDSASAVLLKPAVTIDGSRDVSLSKFTLTVTATEYWPPIGPIYCRSSSVEISRCLLTSNRTPTDMFVALSRKTQAFLHDNTFIGNGGSTSITMGDSSTAEIFRNEFRMGDCAVSIGTGSALIQNNRFFSLTGGAGQIAIHSGMPVTIRNNLFESVNNTNILSISSADVSVVNNTIAGGSTGIDSRNTNAEILNNIITGNQTGVFADPATSTSFNDVWGNLSNFNNIAPGTGDISLNPEFVDSSNHNFRLSEASPCRDAGNPDPAYNDPDLTRNDMGIFGGPYVDTTFFSARGTSLQIMDVVQTSGDTLSIPVAGSPLHGTATADLSIQYDPTRIAFTEARTSASTAPYTLRQSEESPGTVSLSLASPTSMTSDSAVILLLRFIPRTGSFSTTVRFLQAKLHTETTSEIPVARLIDGHLIVTGVNDESRRPLSFDLAQNCPNPFNPVTRIQYSIGAREQVSVKIFDVLGREVTTLVNEVKESGTYSVEWNAGRVSSGVYFCRMQTKSFIGVKKMLLIR